ncbi:hypothetical protein V6N13_114708 [Hibiscus sabdariffa]
MTRVTFPKESSCFLLTHHVAKTGMESIWNCFL